MNARRGPWRSGELIIHFFSAFVRWRGCRGAVEWRRRNFVSFWPASFCAECQTMTVVGENGATIIGARSSSKQRTPHPVIDNCLRFNQYAFSLGKPEASDLNIKRFSCFPPVGSTCWSLGSAEALGVVLQSTIPLRTDWKSLKSMFYSKIKAHKQPIFQDLVDEATADDAPELCTVVVCPPPNRVAVCLRPWFDEYCTTWGLIRGLIRLQVLCRKLCWEAVRSIETNMHEWATNLGTRTDSQIKSVSQGKKIDRQIVIPLFSRRSRRGSIDVICNKIFDISRTFCNYLSSSSPVPPCHPSVSPFDLFSGSLAQFWICLWTWKGLLTQFWFHFLRNEEWGAAFRGGAVLGVTFFLIL